MSNRRLIMDIAPRQPRKPVYIERSKITLPPRHPEPAARNTELVRPKAYDWARPTTTFTPAPTPRAVQHSPVPVPESIEPALLPKLAEPSVEPKVKDRSLLNVRGLLSLVLLLAFGLALGLASYNQKLGQLIIGVYAVLALVFKVKSQYSFGIALFALAMVPMLIVIHKDGLADNYAVYAYLLLVVGVLSAIVELFREKRSLHTQNSNIHNSTGTQY